MSKPQKETIVAAAIRHKGLIFSMPVPARHHNVIYLMTRAGLDIEATEDQGFLTSRGQFVDRNVAMDIAVRADQLDGKPEHPHELFSEDVW